MHITARHHEPEYLQLEIEYYSNELNCQEVFWYDFNEDSADIHQNILNFAALFPKFMREAYEAGKRGDPFELDQIDETVAQAEERTEG